MSSSLLLLFFPSSLDHSLSCTNAFDYFHSSRLVMLTYARRMNHHHPTPLTKASSTTLSTTNPVGSTSSSADEHTSSIGNADKILLLNASLSQEPTTPCILDTPNTCTKNASFFYESPFTIPTTSILSGKYHPVRRFADRSCASELARPMSSSCSALV